MSDPSTGFPTEPAVQPRLEEIPIRLTSGRARQLLDFFWMGIESERDSIKETFGVRFNADGTIELSSEDIRMLEPGQLDEMTERLSLMSKAIAAAQIIQRRYVTG